MIREWLGLGRRADKVAPELRMQDAQTVPVSDTAQMLRLFGIDESLSVEPVTIDSAMGVPAILCAVNFLSATMASLPINVFRREADGGKTKLDSDLAGLLNEAPNEGTSSYEWRKHLFDQVWTGGRGVSFVERNASGRVIGIHGLDPALLTITRRDGRKRYAYRENGRTVVYEASEVIDVPFMLKANGLDARSPILSNAETVGLALAIMRHGTKFFVNGGVPPFAINGGFQTPGAMGRAADDLEEAVRKAAKDRRLGLVLPQGLTITPIGQDAQKAQMVEARRFLIEEFARIFQLPPVFLQDLTHGTFANTEQQDLHLVKHTIRARVTQFEDELNLKLFGWRNRSVFVEMNLDGLLRGDFTTRMEGYATGIQSGVLAPNEARDRENLPRLDGGDGLFMQGAMMPIGQVGQNGGGAAADGGQQQ